MKEGEKTTTNHEEVKTWVDSKQGRPARSKTATGRDGTSLKIIFPGNTDKNLMEITWEEFFDEFDRDELAFVYQEGGRDRYCRIIRRSSDIETGIERPTVEV